MTIRKLKTTLNVLLITTLLFVSIVRAQNPATESHPSRSQAVTPQANNTSVTGSGIIGQLPRWTGSNGAGFVLGDSIITPDKFNNIGKGIPLPSITLQIHKEE